MKRLGSFLTMLCILFGCCVFRPAGADGRSTITTADIKAVLDHYGYKNGGSDNGTGSPYWTYNEKTGDKESYMAGDRPGWSNGWKGYTYSQDSGWSQCAGFALQMGYTLSGFKEDPLKSSKWIRYRSYDAAAADTGGFQVGDIVALKYSGNTHMAMVYKVNGSNYTFVQANGSTGYFKMTVQAV